MKITIGIPTYNQSAFIEAAVSSALAQTYSEIEVIVCDDASTDNTPLLMEQFNANPRFRYIRNKQNIGRVANYRKLLYELAQGDWYVNLDGDDYFEEPTFLEQVAHKIKGDNSIVMAVSNCQLKDEVTHFEKLFKHRYNDGATLSGHQYLLDILHQKAWPTHLSTVYLRAKAMEVGFYTMDIISSDFESLYRLALHGNVVYVACTAGVWRKHGANTVTVKSLQQSMDNIRLPASVSAYGHSLNINLDNWAVGIRQQMIGSILKESQKDRKLLYALFQLLKRYPSDVISLLINRIRGYNNRLIRR